MIVARILQRYVALGPWAGATIAVLGGRLARKGRPHAQRHARGTPRGARAARRDSSRSSCAQGAFEPDSHLDDEKREAWRSFLEAQTDAELTFHLLSMHKALELKTCGRMHKWAEGESTALTVFLDRFAPVAFGDALAMYEEHAEPLEQGTVAS